MSTVIDVFDDEGRTAHGEDIGRARQFSGLATNCMIHLPFMLVADKLPGYDCYVIVAMKWMHF